MNLPQFFMLTLLGSTTIFYLIVKEASSYGKYRGILHAKPMCACLGDPLDPYILIFLYAFPQYRINKLNKGGVEKISKFNLNIEQTPGVNSGDDVEQIGEIYEKTNKKGSRKRKQASQVEEEVQLEDAVVKPATVRSKML
ncbi:hypothetical protein GQX74_009403 [Glossina fuscipes]|nr:hypothetical protein GQX74_009403 [Glossina fuscipes]